jgi:hypothetical protein
MEGLVSLCQTPRHECVTPLPLRLLPIRVLVRIRIVRASRMRGQVVMSIKLTDAQLVMLCDADLRSRSAKQAKRTRQEVGGTGVDQAGFGKRCFGTEGNDCEIIARAGPLSSPVTKSRFQFVFVAMAITSAAGSPLMTAIRAKVRAVSVRRTRTMALRTSAASLGVPFRRARASGGRG